MCTILRHVSRRLPLIHHPSRRSYITTFPISFHLPTDATSRPPTPSILHRALADSLQRAERVTNPSEVWSTYTELIGSHGYNSIPLEVHQQVLRKCTYPPANLRVMMHNTVSADSRLRFHLYERRFREIFSNIAAIGQLPTLDDYHFILEQFVAVGYETGAIQVYKELVRQGLTPRSKTYGLCLQAIAHRLTLPVAKADRTARMVRCRQLLAVILGDMFKNKKPFRSVNLDIAIRVMKYTLDFDSFDLLMKRGYGIDLANPDRVALQENSEKSLEGFPTIPERLHFSTASLNTTIDMLGQLQMFSKMVQTFEVMTNPLPGAQQHTNASFDDDTEDDFGVSVETPSPSPQYAPPNSKTYHILLWHLSRANHGILLRHYLLQAMEYERMGDNNLRRTLIATPRRLHTEIPAPSFSVHKNMLMPALRYSNQRKDRGLMKWLRGKLTSVLKMKQRDLLFYEGYRKGMIRMGICPYDGSRHIDPLLVEYALKNWTPKRKPKSPKHTTPPPHLISSSQEPSPNVGAAVDPAPLSPVPLISADPQVKETGNTDTESQSVPPFKHFDLDLYISVLKRDISDIKEFDSRLHEVLGRTTQRIKEYLGRRVWNDKDIYLLTENDTRQRKVVSREKWASIVGFKSRRKYDMLRSVGSTSSTPPIHRLSDLRTRNIPNDALP